MEWLSQSYPTVSNYINDAFLKQEEEKKIPAIILFCLLYYLPSDKVQIDDERHKGNQRIRNCNQHSK